jgi:Uma2 family endonuclease
MTTLERAQLVEIPERMKWTRDRYYAALARDLFGDWEKVELIGGELVTEGMADRMAQKTSHQWAVRRVSKRLEAVFREGYDVRPQLPLALLDDSDPEPDIAVVTGSEDDYLDSPPRTAVVVVEISDSTLRYDRTYKASLYAAAGIQDYWILNLPQRTLEVRRAPVTDGSQPFGWTYSEISALRAGEAVSPLGHSEAVILSVADLLPPEK